MKLEQIKFKAWIMFENFTFHKVTGTFKQIKREIDLIKNEDPGMFAGWGKFTFLDDDTEKNYIFQEGLMQDTKMLTLAEIEKRLVKRNADVKANISEMETEIALRKKQLRALKYQTSKRTTG